MIGIYKFENKYDRKVYIGQSINIENRVKGHRKAVKTGDNTYFHRALRKYGIENFDFNVLIECPKENLNYWEKFYIKFYCSNNPNYGYNMTEGGEGVQLFGEQNGMYGKHHSNESKKKMSANRKGRKWTEEQRQKMDNYFKTHDAPMKGKHHTPETIEKCRIGNTGKHPSAETIEKRKAAQRKWLENNELPFKGKPAWNSGKEQKSHMSEESLEKCREAGRIHGSKLWIYKDNVQKRCLPEELDYYIELGYSRGRINYTHKRHE